MNFARCHDISCFLGRPWRLFIWNLPLLVWVHSFYLDNMLLSWLPKKRKKEKWIVFCDKTLIDWKSFRSINGDLPSSWIFGANCQVNGKFFTVLNIIIDFWVSLSFLHCYLHILPKSIGSFPRILCTFHLFA